jgi:putative CocE/NonD family hydrolase
MSSVAGVAEQPRSARDRLLDRVATSLSGLPRATTDYTVARGIRIPTRAGIELAADLYRPRENAVGTLLLRGPYGRSLALALLQARIFVARGYNALFASSRGTFGSGGTFDPMMTEVDDGHDVVAWMRDQPWFTGTFATVGGSYLGHTQWALMTEPPPELAAAVVSIGPHDFHHHVWGTGAFRLDFLGWSYGVVHQEDGGTLKGVTRLATSRRRIDPYMNQLPLARAAETCLDGRAPWYVEWVTRPEADDPYWAPMQHGIALEKVEVPVLLIGGWQDIFLEQTLQQYARLHARGVDVAMTIGPWSHLGAGAGGARVASRETFDWLEEHLSRRGRRRRPAPVRVFVTGAKEWRDLREWPPPPEMSTLYLHHDHSLAPLPPSTARPPSSFTFDPADPTPTVGGAMLQLRCRVEDSALAERPDVLAYTGPVLERPLEIVGTPVVELFHLCDNPHADLFARVSEVDRRGRSHNVTEGYARLDPTRPDDASTVTLALRPTAHRFATGSRVRLLVAGGSQPQFARNLGTGENPGTGVGLRPARHSVGHHPDDCSRLLLPGSG